MRLEIRDGSDRQVDVVAPTRQDRIGFNSRVFRGFKGREEGLTHPFLQRMPALIETWKDRMADERVRVLVGVTARGPIGIA